MERNKPARARQFLKRQGEPALGCRFDQIKIVVSRDAPALLPSRDCLVWLPEVRSERGEGRPVIEDMLHA